MGSEMVRGGFNDLRKAVIDTGLCTMCGGCIASCPVSVLAFEEDSIALRGDCIRCGTCLRICPGKGVDLSRREQELFGRSRRSGLGTRMGIHVERAHLTSSISEFIRAGYYGGRVVSVLIAALEEGLIDSALMTGWGEKGLLSQGSAAIARTREEVLSLASSKYVFSPVLTLLKEARQDDTIQRIAVVGLPCHIHALRKMMDDPSASEYTSKVEYVIGLNCGAPMMSEGDWRTSISHLLGIGPDEITGFAAHKVAGTRIGLEADLKEGKHVSRVVPIGSYLSVFARGPIWSRCLLCTDYSSELSDVTFGAPVIRTEKGRELVENALEKGYLKRSSLRKRLSQNVTDIYVGSRKKRRSRRNLRKRASRGQPIPEYG